MSPQTDAERELAQLLVESLNLAEVEPGSIDPEAPLFNTGLGLDSNDALELALAISKRYGFQLREDNDENGRIFDSPPALSDIARSDQTAGQAHPTGAMKSVVEGERGHVLVAQQCA